MQGWWPPNFAAQPPGFLTEVAAGAVAKADPATLMLTPEPDLPKSGESYPAGLIPAWGNNGRSACVNAFVNVTTPHWT